MGLTWILRPILFAEEAQQAQGYFGPRKGHFRGLAEKDIETGYRLRRSQWQEAI
jgi:hypothetical protein